MGRMNLVQQSFSEEDAPGFGKRTAICNRCGRTLRTEKSVALGYGPLCAKIVRQEIASTLAERGEMQ
jgi:hypothetical protein